MAIFLTVSCPPRWGRPCRPGWSGSTREWFLPPRRPLGESRSQDLEERDPGDTGIIIPCQANLSPFVEKITCPSKYYSFEETSISWTENYSFEPILLLFNWSKNNFFEASIQMLKLEPNITHINLTSIFWFQPWNWRLHKHQVPLLWQPLIAEYVIFNCCCIELAQVLPCHNL